MLISSNKIKRTVPVIPAIARVVLPAEDIAPVLIDFTDIPNCEDARLQCLRRAELQ